MDKGSGEKIGESHGNPFPKYTWLPYVFWKMSQMIDTASPPFNLIWKITTVDYEQPLMNSEQEND